MNFYLHRENGKKEIFSSNNYFNGYEFNPKKNKTLIKVNHITVVDPKMIDSILTLKFNKRFNKLLKYVTYLLNESNDDTGIAIALNEVEKLRGILLNRYQKFLNQEKEELFLKKLRIIENELRLKEVMINNYLSNIEQESRSR